MSKKHVLILPFPAQGHVSPLMDLSHELAKHGIKITFVNTDFTHKQIMEAHRDNKEQVTMRSDQIQLVSLPDGLEQGENRNRLEILMESIWEVMPKKLEKLIQDINEADSEKISCVVADVGMGWALEVAERIGIQRAGFLTTSASVSALGFSIPKLLDDGVIDGDGTPIKDDIIHLGPNMPAMRTKHLVWTHIGDEKAQKTLFNFMKRNIKAAKLTEWMICNSSHELEPSAFAFAPNIIAVGPLQASKINRGDDFPGSFRSEDSTCLNWLDQQSDKSVIYIAFGSFTIFDLLQVQELALGLELSDKPFLWVVRSDFNNKENHVFLKAFEDRLSSRGKAVSWAPQHKILEHPSITCFLSHCSWNSTIEGIINGVLFLCWPYFTDQFINKTFICDIWKIGLRLDRDK